MKIQPEAHQLLANFHENWDPILERLPIFKLDNSWPSTATLDLISFGARLLKERPSGMQTMIRGCACYLAQIVGHAWEQVADDVEITYTAEQGVTLIAKNSRFFSDGEHLLFRAEKVLSDILSDLPDPFPVIRGVDRRISFDSNVISILAIGAAIGLHPSVEGAWVDRSFADLKEPLQLVTKEFARQTSEYYARVFPDEPLGAVAEIYLSSLVFPPLFVGEPLPAMNAIQNVFDFAKRYNITKDQLCKLGRNWARLADDTISCVGIVLYAACLNEKPGPDIIAVAQAKADFMGLLRTALVVARKFAQNDENYADWLESGIQDAENILEFEIEQDLLFLPWVTLSESYIKVKHHSIKDALTALSKFDMAASEKNIDSLIELEPSEIELRLQRIKLEMIKGDWEQADSMFRALLSETDTDSNPLFFHLWSLVALAKGDASSALKYCKAGLAVCEEESRLYPELKNNCGWSNLMNGEVEKSLKHFEDGLQQAYCPLTLLLNKAHVLWRLGQNEKVSLIKDELKGLAPSDRRVFASLATE